MTNHLRLVLLALALPAAGLAPAAEVDESVFEAQRRRVEVVDRVAPTVVAIFGAGGGGGGSGVLVSADGYVVTNFHVTSGAGDFMKCGLDDGRLHDAVIVGVDPTGDVALVKMLGRDDFPFAPLGDSDLVRQGDWVYAMGNPFLLATDFAPTVTYGIVSGVHRYQYPAGTFLEYTDCIQVDASINPGNSGGPLFNEAGEVIGINGRGSFEKRGRVNSGAGYAISSNQVKHFLDHLKSGRVVDHATLGATVTTWDDGGIRVGNILEESEAYRRGVRIDDEIVFFGGRPIGSVNQFKNVLGIYPKGWKVPLTYRRDGRKHDIVVRLRALHRESELVPQKPGRPQQPAPMPMPGDDPEKKPGDEKPEGDRPRIPIPLPGHAAPAAPKEYEHMLVKKDGYANYYFNELERKRVLAGLDELGDFSGTEALWKLSGNAGGKGEFTFTMAEKGVGLVLGPDPFYQAYDGSPLLDEPAGTGGLVVAGDQLRRLLAARDNGFTELYYLGSEPLDGTGERVDVLIGRRSTATTRFYFSKASGQLVGWDTEIEEDVDSSEIRISDWQTYGDVRLPKTWKVSRAGEELLVLVLEDAMLGAGAATGGNAE